MILINPEAFMFRVLFLLRIELLVFSFILEFS